MTREELLNELEARGDDAGITLGELEAAMEDGRLTRADLETYMPKWLETERKVAEMTTPITDLFGGIRQQLAGVVDNSARWSEHLTALGDKSADRFTSLPYVPALGQGAQIRELAGLRADLAEMIEVLRTSGEQIGAIATVASATLSGIQQLAQTSNAALEESVSLRGSLDKGQTSADNYASRLQLLTIVLLLVTALQVGIAVYQATHSQNVSVTVAPSPARETVAPPATTGPGAASPTSTPRR